MNIRYEAMAAQARDTLDALRTDFQHRTNEIRTTWSRATLAAIRAARARLARWEPIVAALAMNEWEAEAADAPQAQGSSAQSPPTDPSAAPPPIAARRSEHANGQSSAAASC